MCRHETFTETVNFRKLASQLRRDGHAAVPSNEIIRAAARLHGLQDWADHCLKTNEANFFSLIAFHMMDVGDE